MAYIPKNTRTEKYIDSNGFLRSIVNKKDLDELNKRIDNVVAGTEACRFNETMERTLHEHEQSIYDLKTKTVTYPLTHEYVYSAVKASDGNYTGFNFVERMPGASVASSLSTVNTIIKDKLQPVVNNVISRVTNLESSSGTATDQQFSEAMEYGMYGSAMNGITNQYEYGSPTVKSSTDIRTIIDDIHIQSDSDRNAIMHLLTKVQSLSETRSNTNEVTSSEFTLVKNQVDTNTTKIGVHTTDITALQNRVTDVETTNTSLKDRVASLEVVTGTDGSVIEGIQNAITSLLERYEAVNAKVDRLKAAVLEDLDYIWTQLRAIHSTLPEISTDSSAVTSWATASAV